MWTDGGKLLSLEVNSNHRGKGRCGPDGGGLLSLEVNSNHADSNREADRR